MSKKIDHQKETPLRDFVRKVLLDTTCSKCDFDEAEGGIMNHCPDCCHKVVQELWAKVFGA